MFAVKSTGWIVPAIAALAASGCVMTSGNLSSSAERLERSAYDLTEESRDDRAGADYSRDAQEFAEEARDFRRVVEDRDSDGDEVQNAFRDLSERYHALRDEVDDANSSDAEIEFKDVTEAYLDIEREMGRDGDRYASD
ncbi:MAG: hypothetical protein ACREV5_15515 [Steroidobacter sp.]